MKWKIATAAAMTAVGLTVTTAATAQAPNNHADFKARFGCHDIQPGNWSTGTKLLTRRVAVKTTLYVLPGEQTAMIRRGTNHATVAAVSSYGQLRMVCSKVVPWRQKPELGS